MVERWWLRMPYVEPGAGQVAAGERGRQRQLVVNAAARGGDENRAGFHACERGGVHHAHRAGIARTMQRHEIRACQQVVEGGRLRAAAVDFIRAQQRVESQHGHAERARQRRDASAGMADADQTDDLAREFAPHHVFARKAAFAAQAPIAFADAPRNVEHQADGMFGHRGRVAAGLVDHRDARRGAGRHVDGVVAGAGGRGDQELRAAGKEGRVDEQVRGQFVLGRRDMEHVRGGQHRARIVGRRADLANAQGDAGFARQALFEDGAEPEVGADDGLDRGGHGRDSGNGLKAAR